MKVTRILAALALVVGLAGAAHAQGGCARLSWNTCDPWVENASYLAPNVSPASFVLVESAIGLQPVAQFGHVSTIHIGTVSGPVPDAWRFDDTGCQTGSQIAIANQAFSKACPLLQGVAPLPVTNYFVDPGTHEVDISLSDTYNDFTPSSATRYTLWKVTFDMSFGSVGPTPPDGSTCGGVEQCENLDLTKASYRESNPVQDVNMPGCDTDPNFPAGLFPSGFATWNGGCRPVATQPSTWGHLKGLYH